jgi:predicted dehydrogenase
LVYYDQGQKEEKAIMKERDKIGAGVIGVGTYGEWHARTYAEFYGSDLIAIADLNEERAKKVAVKYKAKYYYKDYRALLDRSDIEVVSIVLPDFLHREACIYAAKAGKHILVEKPLATSVEDGLAIIETAKKSKVKLMVDFANRWNPPFLQAKRAISEGRIGQVRYIYVLLNDSISVPTNMLSWSGKSSVAWFLGTHCVDLCRWLIGSEVETVSGVSRSGILTNRGIDTPDFYQALLEFENGSITNVENCWILPESCPTIFDFKAEIIGNKGKITISTAQHDVIQECTATEGIRYPDVLLFIETNGSLTGFGKEPILHFVKSVIKKDSPAVTMEDGLEATRIIAAVEQSAKEGGKKIKIRR